MLSLFFSIAFGRCCNIALLCLISSITAAVASSHSPDGDAITVPSTPFPGVRIQYRRVDSVCPSSTSTTPSYAGYIHVPADVAASAVGLVVHRPINTFFWYFESQENADTAPLTLYLNGGPGAPSTTAALRENGPCRIGVDGKTTRENPWSWNRVSNMLYIDQPVNTGFSYDILSNATLDLRGSWSRQDGNKSSDLDDRRLLHEPGIVGLGATEEEPVFNTTSAAVRALWVSLAAWLADFPPYHWPAHPDDDDDDDNNNNVHPIDLWTISYGGHYAPALYDFVAERKATAKRREPEIRFRTIGLLNACVDALVQLPSYPDMAYNNTYGLELIDKAAHADAHAAWSACKSRILACRRRSLDGNNDDTCHEANRFCGEHMVNKANAAGRSFYDIGYGPRHLADPELRTYLAFLKQDRVLGALGVSVNFTDRSDVISAGFSRTGDNLRGDYAASLGRALDAGVRVHLVYGDRDYACNWLGGEALSKAIPQRHSREFKKAGYQVVQWPSSSSSSSSSSETSLSEHPAAVAYVRQYGGLSFTRVLDAGHTINTDRPDVGFLLFKRTVAHVDLSSGLVGPADRQQDLETPYGTDEGLDSTWHVKSKLPVDAFAAEGMCYTLAPSMCSKRQLAAYVSGRGTVQDYWLVSLGDEGCSPNPVRPCEMKEEDDETSFAAEGGGQMSRPFTNYLAEHSKAPTGILVFVCVFLGLGLAGLLWYSYIRLRAASGTRYHKLQLLEDENAEGSPS